jgi:capsular polysaccharide biosynthesis protein
MKKGRLFAARLYACLLRFYPERFRDEFGTDMEQVFADQYFAASKDGPLSLACFWIRTIKDFFKSLILQHLEQSRSHMNAHSVLQYCSRSLTFSRLFAGTTICLLSLCLIVTVFVLPKVYVSTARISLSPPNAGPIAYDPYFVQTSFEKIKSQKVLNAVIEELNLAAVLANEAGVTPAFTTAEAYKILLSMIELRQSRSTSLVEIRVYSEKPELSASIANKIAEVARRIEKNDLVDAAIAEARPVRPNIPLNLVIGTVASLAAAVFLAGLTRLLLRAVRTTEAAKVEAA